MKSLISAIVIFSILLNLSAGIMMISVVDQDGNRVFGNSDVGSFSNVTSSQYGEKFYEEMGESVQPSGQLEDKGDQIYRVLDMLSLGFIYKFINIVDEYMFGFINMLDNIFSDMLADDVSTMLFGEEGNFGALKTLVTISYILMGVYLFTGKDVVEG